MILTSRAQPVTLTAGPSTYRYSSYSSTSTSGHEVEATALEDCDLQGTSQAVCRITMGGSLGKNTTWTATTTTYIGNQYRLYDVPITAGAEKLASPTAECKSASGASTKAVALWTLVGSVGLALLW